MILPSRDIHKLKKVLSDDCYQVDQRKRICGLADILINKSNGIDLDDKAWVFWGNVLGQVLNDTDKTLDFLKAAITEFPSPVFVAYEKQIRLNRSARLRKIKTALQDERCVIFLGPDALLVREGRALVPFNEYLSARLQKLMDDHSFYYDPHLHKNLSYLSQCFMETETYIQGDTGDFAFKHFKALKRGAKFETKLFTQLARLPLKLVINANPDRLLFDALQKRPGIVPVMEVYDLCNNYGSPGEGPAPVTATPENIIISKERPFVYNIFGSFDNEESVLFTESDFLKFISHVIQGDPPLNRAILGEFSKKDTYLFLGFDFEQWYFKILFQLFKIKKEDDFASLSCNLDAGSGAAAPAKISVYNREFFEHEFKIFFVDEDLIDFTKDLVKFPIDVDHA